MKLAYTIESTYEDYTIKQYLSEVLKLSRTNIIALKTSPDGILVNDSKVTVRYVLKANDKLLLSLPDKVCTVVPSCNPLDILYDDAYLYIINKPQGLPIHPDRKYKDDTLGNRIIGNIDFSGQKQLHIVTRLDKDTQGLVLGAKDCITKRLLVELLEQGTLNKTYIALVDGVPQKLSGTIDIALSRNDSTNTTYPDENGKRAVTKYKVLWQNESQSLIMLNPLNGRTHQLRAHLKAIGCPIVGDKIYGKCDNSNYQLRLLMYRLQFVHPYNNTQIDIKAPLPQWAKSIAPLLIDEQL